MAQKRRLARRYAEALGMLAEERDLLDRVESDMEAVHKLLTENAEFSHYLYNEQIPSAERCDFLQTVFKGKLADVSLHFLYLVINKHRVRYLEAMIDAYVEYANERRGIIVLRVTTAKELSEIISQELAQGLGEALDAQVRLRTFIDPALLGGVTVRVGDLLIDGSAVSRLARLGRTLRAAQLN